MFVVRDSSRAGFNTVVLHDEIAGSRVEILPGRGALVTSFEARDREWLYLDPVTLADASQNVRGGIPVLFPSPGKLAKDAFSLASVAGLSAVAAGRCGTLKQHGFARTSAFSEVGRGTDGAPWVLLELVDSEATRVAFPFAFRLRLRFALAAASLSIRAEVLNTGHEALPFALGYHPYFSVAADDKGASRIPTRATRAWDNVDKREVAMGPLDLAGAEVDLHLLDHDANSARLETPRGEIDLAGPFDRWVVWTLPGKPFVCLEPWTAPADALNSGEGLVVLAPGEERVLTLEIGVR